jgi:hypothetical protein
MYRIHNTYLDPATKQSRSDKKRSGSDRVRIQKSSTLYIVQYRYIRKKSMCLAGGGGRYVVYTCLVIYPIATCTSVAFVRSLGTLLKKKSNVTGNQFHVSLFTSRNLNRMQSYDTVYRRA